MKQVLLSLLVLTLAAGVTSAQKPKVILKDKPGWHKIGTTKVDFKTDRDQIVVLGANRFKSIQIKVSDAPVRIEDLQIQYQNGETESVVVGTDFQPGAESKVIELKNSNAEIKKVSFVYKTITNAADQRAEVELWALK